MVTPDASLSASFASGLVAGSVASLAGQPIDTVRIKLQCERGLALSASTLGVTRNLWKTEGLRGFYRGWLPPLWATGPRNAIGFTYTYIINIPLASVSFFTYLSQVSQSRTK